MQYLHYEFVKILTEFIFFFNFYWLCGIALLKHIFIDIYMSLKFLIIGTRFIDQENSSLIKDILKYVNKFQL